MLHEFSKQPLAPSHCDSPELVSETIKPPTRTAADRAVLRPVEGQIGAIEIMHAATFCSDGALDRSGRLNGAAQQYLDQLQSLGISGLYLVGIYKTSVFSELIMPHFAESWPSPPIRPEYVGPSVFAVDELVPGFSIKNWEVLKTISSELEKRGIALIVDFIPNTIGLDSTITRLNPDLISDALVDPSELAVIKRTVSRAGRPIYEKSKISDDLVRHSTAIYRVDPDREIIAHSRYDQSGVSWKFYLDRRLSSGFKPHFWMERIGLEASQIFCKELGRDTSSGVVWADVARLKTWSSAVQEQQIGFLANLSKIVPAVRADMSHLPGRDYWRSIVERAEETSRPLPAIIAETYGCGKHSELASLGIRSYANWIREWLNEGRIDLILNQLYSEPNGAKFLAENAVVYTANHDDGRGADNLIEGAKTAIAAALPARHIMFAQGQRQGDNHRYGADQHVPWSAFAERSAAARAADPDYSSFMERMIRLSGAAVFREPASSCAPAKILDIGERRPDRIFHTVRQLNDERVLVLVDFQQNGRGPIKIDLPATFGINEEAASSAVLEDLLVGGVAPAGRILELHPRAPGAGYDVHILRLTGGPERK